MNRKLADNSQRAALPECIEEFFDYGIAVCCAFNRFGTLLATGTNDGYIGIWDFETRGLAKVLPDGGSPPETCTVTSLCWSHNGRYLLAGQKNKRAILWDVLEGKQLHEVLLPSAVEHVSLSAQQPFTAVVSLQSGPPVLLELTDSPVQTPLDTNIDLKAVIESSGGSTKLRGGSGDQQAPVAVLSRSGREVFVGLQQANRGFLLVYDVASKQLLDIYKLPAAVLSMSPACQGSMLLLSCSDKVVRLAEVQQRPADAQPVSKKDAEAALSKLGPGALGSLLLGEPRSLISLWPITYQNAVEKAAWLSAVVSHDGQHVVGAAAGTSNHRLYIWDKAQGKLVCILEGPQGVGMSDVAWHPSRPLMVTIAGSSKGQVYIWAPVYNENWSAFAPDFKELDENQDYVEAEDEFDINPRNGNNALRNGTGAEQDVEADIFTREPSSVYDDAQVEEGDQAEGKDAPLPWLPAEVDVSPPDKDGTEQQSSGDASDDDGGPEASGRTAAGAESDGAGTDQPRERKRKVRFQREEELDDDAFDDLLMRQQREEQRQGGKGGGKGSKHGLPPLPRPPKEEGQGPQQAGGRGPKGSGGSGSALNAADGDAGGAYGPNSAALLGASSSSKSMLEHQVQLQRQLMEQQQDRQT